MCGIKFRIQLIFDSSSTYGQALILSSTYLQVNNIANEEKQLHGPQSKLNGQETVPIKALAILSFYYLFRLQQSSHPHKKHDKEQGDHTQYAGPDNNLSGKVAVSAHL